MISQSAGYGAVRTIAEQRQKSTKRAAVEHLSRARKAKTSVDAEKNESCALAYTYLVPKADDSIDRRRSGKVEIQTSEKENETAAPTHAPLKSCDKPYLRLEAAGILRQPT